MGPFRSILHNHPWNKSCCQRGWAFPFTSFTHPQPPLTCSDSHITIHLHLVSCINLRFSPNGKHQKLGLDQYFSPPLRFNPKTYCRICPYKTHTMKNKNRVKTLLKIEVGVFRSSLPKVKNASAWGTQEVACQICFEPWILKRTNRISISSSPTIKPSFLGKSTTKNAKQTTTRVTRVEMDPCFQFGWHFERHLCKQTTGKWPQP